MKKNKIIFTTMFVLGLIFFIFIFLYKNKKIKLTKKIEQKISNNTSDVKIDDFNLEQAFSNNKNKWVLKAKNGHFFSKTNTAVCNIAEAVFLKNNKKIAILCAPKAKFYIRKNKIELSGGIKSKILNNPAGNNSCN